MTLAMPCSGTRTSLRPTSDHGNGIGDPVSSFNTVWTLTCPVCWRSRKRVGRGAWIRHQLIRPSKRRPIYSWKAGRPTLPKDPTLPDREMLGSKWVITEPCETCARAVVGYVRTPVDLRSPADHLAAIQQATKRAREATQAGVRRCVQCDVLLDERTRADATYCSPRCRKRALRRRERLASGKTLSVAMKSNDRALRVAADKEEQP